MVERPILFSSSMVRAILDGRKTQTRRLVKAQPPACKGFPHRNPVAEWGIYLDRLNAGPYKHIGACPYGLPGDRLWVRETHKFTVRQDWKHIRVDYAAGGFKDVPSPSPVPCEPKKWRPSIFMPRWACRLVLEVTAVRVERLQVISEADAKAEGVEQKRYLVNPFKTGALRARFSGEESSFAESYALLWDSLNAKRAPWSSNPWVWVVEFKRSA